MKFRQLEGEPFQLRQSADGRDDGVDLAEASHSGVHAEFVADAMSHHYGTVE